MLKRDENGEDWIVNDLEISKDKSIMKGIVKIFVDNIYCGQYQDLIGDGQLQKVNC